jgi:hypothetical protein
VPQQRQVQLQRSAQINWKNRQEVRPLCRYLLPIVDHLSGDQQPPHVSQHRWKLQRNKRVQTA